jgi:hypothetical protein
MLHRPVEATSGKRTFNQLKIAILYDRFRPRLRQKRRPMVSLPVQQKSVVFFDLTD